MADLHPTEGNISVIPTDPPSNTTAIFRKQPLVYSQLGRATSYNSNGEEFSFSTKPSYYQLAAWDSVRRKEPIIKQGLEYIIQALIARIGSYSHPDPEIDDFVQANIQDNIKKWIIEIATPSLWCGYGVSEINWQKKIGPNETPQVWVDSLINYHPLQVYLHLNDFGVVKDGDKVTHSPFKSGVWVPAPYPLLNSRYYSSKREILGNLVRLPKSKRVYITLNGEGNNPYGKSILEPVLPYHYFKEAYRDMLTVALDRYGTPLIYVVVPPVDTRETVEEPDGTIRPKTLHEVTTEEMQNLSGETALVFTQISKDQPIKVEAITTGNNFSDSFNQAIELCDNNMMMGLGIPNLLMRDNSNRLGSGGASERQLELFNTFVSSLFDSIVQPFTNQLCAQLIQYNFDPRRNPKAYLSGSIQKRPTRNSELKTLIEAIDSLSNLGFINPSNEIDFKHVRELVEFPDREIDKDDFTVIFPDRRQERININQNTNIDGDSSNSSTASKAKKDSKVMPSIPKASPIKDKKKVTSK
ncbi:hypothetical protein H6G33_09405 [Calothrix sp. FACHB-1219]|uniref:phage portal protein family protein n=1 Tax=unclassified Calothrix TaxID=2619626 RepID=UPI001688240E|nr:MULTISPECIES: hypothetical protein [unclassified Calothrix]MBD2201562.1 hypothetical protein [Calothrix sp. FACHB-168]MBD2217248.1 hypothetical protein [Calothrix sp. FACHB-1219]